MAEQNDATADQTRPHSAAAASTLTAELTGILPGLARFLPAVIPPKFF
jgi:hypothetical protein